MARKPLTKLSDASFYLLAAVAQPFEMIIKSAIIIETELEAIFQTKFAGPRYIYELGLTYEQKILLVLALGLDDRLKPPLTNLATLRNKFAHNLDVNFGIDQAKNFYSTFHKIDRDIVRENYERLSQSRGVSFEELSAADLFTICIVTLRAAIVTAKLTTDNRRVNER